MDIEIYIQWIVVRLNFSLSIAIVSDLIGNAFVRSSNFNFNLSVPDMEEENRDRMNKKKMKEEGGPLTVIAKVAIGQSLD